MVPVETGLDGGTSAEEREDEKESRRRERMKREKKNWLELVIAAATMKAG